ncbi:response regulator [Paenibacillus sp. LHD-117]|uniref:response regulator transcription factor n=1 Tax=Paenibacillus sp. LHD-117 TaxID=3071412 RepID=UPI0027E0E36C|nr:helix-turn-helix domain-containing protein [Paenibacillus sp. LHD-117]MDQ6423597.1 response regulator [Paenibacillus sp. LHD-117]
MFNLLVVDDEVFAVQAILQGIDWTAHGFNGAYGAGDVDEAKELLSRIPIDILLCDIDMPGSNGLELAEWLNKMYPWVVTIFLTGHANFTYAQQAIHVGSFEYLLKPVKHEQLLQVVNRALDQVKINREMRDFNETYKTNSKLWIAKRPVLHEHFWQDVLSERIYPSTQNISELHDSYQLPLMKDSRILLILLSVEQWLKEITQRDEDIMEYVLRNAAAELFLHNFQGAVIQDQNGFNLIVMYVQGDKAPSREELSAICQKYLEACSHYFFCSLSCYVGEAVPIDQITQTYHLLIEMEHNNVTHTKVIRFQKDDQSQNLPPLSQRVTLLIEWSEWAGLLEMGKKEELLSRIDDMFAELDNNTVNAEALESLYYSLLHLIYHVAHKKGWSVQELLGSKRGADRIEAIRSLGHLRKWATRIIGMAIEFIHSHEKESSVVIGKVKQYIRGHLKDVTRMDIAAYVYLNSAYLSRLFKKETGQSLLDYIIHEKMDQSKIMLTESNMRINDICESIGYDNVSHFGKMFKKQVGISPQEYRKRYQQLT